MIAISETNFRDTIAKMLAFSFEKKPNQEIQHFPGKLQDEFVIYHSKHT